MRPIFDEDSKQVIGLLEMTSLRGLDGIHAKPDSHQKNGSLNMRDDSVLDHFTRQVSRGLIDINDRELFIGNKSIFEFGFEMSQKNDPFQAIQADVMQLPLPVMKSPTHSAREESSKVRPSRRSASSSEDEEV